MHFFDQLQAQTQVEREYLLSAPIITQVMAGTVSPASYLAFLAQAYHHVKHTVPLLMACGARLPERLEWLREAIAEYTRRSTAIRSGFSTIFAPVAAMPRRCGWKPPTWRPS